MKVFKVDTDGTQKVGDLLASESPLDTTNFDKNLDGTITDVQKLADAVDELELSSLPSGTTNQTLRHDGTNWVVNSILQVTNALNSSSQSVEITSTGVNSGYALKATINCDYNRFNHAGIFSNTNTNNGTSVLNVGVSAYINNAVSFNSYGFIAFVKRTQIGYAIYTSDNPAGYVYKVDGNGNIYSNTLAGTGDRPVFADKNGKLKVGTATDNRNYIEFLSDPLTVASDGYAFSNTQLGLDGINLNDKVKMVQCYVIQADYPNIKNNELVMGHNIEDGQISVRTNFNLAVGDRIKIYIEYID